MKLDDIAAMEDPARRNLWITQTYHELGRDLAGRGLDPDATWLLFAVWASKTAGRIIRGDELPARLRQAIGGSQRIAETRGRVNHRWRWLRRFGLLSCLDHGHLVRAAEEVAAAVSARIAEGNRLVFAELAPVFAALAAGEPPPEPPAGLAPAVEAYERALIEPDPSRRARLILAANVAAVAHEQHRLQPDIEAALDAPIADGVQRLVDAEIVRILPGRLARALAAEALDAVCREMERIWREAATATMMRLTTPDEDLDLHETLPAVAGGPLFGAPLDDPEAATALAPWDRTAGCGGPCGATDWAVEAERMNFIVNFFRSRQRNPQLASPPFSDAQLAALEAGILPDGPL